MLLRMIVIYAFPWFLSYTGPTNKSCEEDRIPTPTSTKTAPAAEIPSKVVGVFVTPSAQNTSPTLTVEWKALAGGAVTYTVKYSTQPGEVNAPPEGALEVRGLSGTSIILTALERGTTYYIWVVGVSEGGEGPHSDRMSGRTHDSELDTTNCAYAEGYMMSYECLEGIIFILHNRQPTITQVSILQVSALLYSEHESSNLQVWPSLCVERHNFGNQILHQHL